MAGKELASDCIACGACEQACTQGAPIIEAKLILALGKIGEFELWFSASQATDIYYVLSDFPVFTCDDLFAWLEQKHGLIYAEVGLTGNS